MKQVWRRFKDRYDVFFRLFGDYKLQIAVLIAIGVSSSLLGGLSIGALVPLITFAVEGGEVGNDFISHFIQKVFFSLGVEVNLYTLLSLIALLFILKAVFLFIFSYVTIRISNACENNYRRHFYSATLEAGWPYLLRHKLGHLQSILVMHVESIPRLMNLLSNIFLNFTNFFIYLLLAFRLSFVTTGLAFLFGGVILLLSYPLARRTKLLTDQQYDLVQGMSHEVSENVTGLKTIKAMNVERESMRQTFGLFDRLVANKLKLFFVRKLNSLAIEPLGIIFVAIIFSFLFTSGNFDLGVFAVLIYLIQKIFAFVEDLQGSFHSLNSARQFVRKLLSFDEEIRRAKEEDQGEEEFRFERELEFKKVNFSYPRAKGKPRSLKEVSFKVRKGEMVGIIGPSGAGKTTLVDLFLRLFEPASGEILIDGRPIRKIKLASWRRKAGYVSQDIFLKNDTVFNNIKFYDDSISAAEVEEAVRAAYLYDLVTALPEGFNTSVGERGIRFSAGERQRIVLARIFARRPEILILDEATSALDNESEIMIKKAIAELRGKVTVIVIAHRLSTIRNADRLVVLEGGEVIEEGVPARLLADKDSYFYRVYNIIQENHG